MDTQKNWRGYVDFFKASAYTQFPQTHRCSPGRLPFQMISVHMDAHNIADPNVSDLVLTLPIAVSPQCEWSWNLGDGWRRERLSSGRMLVIPPLTESRWNVEGSRRLLVLIVAAQTVARVLGPACPPDVSKAIFPLAQSTWEDPMVEMLMRRLWLASEGREPTDRLLVDGTIVAILSQMLQRAGTSVTHADTIAMSPVRLKRVVDYAEAHLHSDVDLLSLAEIAGLSVRHFARAFRQDVGETPHRWLMSRRIERAKGMLSNTHASLVEIANVCGFADQSHLTSMMKKATGVTPSQWRKQCHPM